jgi:hypothetical protein
VELHWPAQLAVSPLDSSLHLVDNNQVLTEVTFLSIVIHTLDLWLTLGILMVECCQF